MTATEQQGDDYDTGWAGFRARLFPPSAAAPEGSWLRFKMNSAGLNIARQLAAARNRGLAAWKGEHGAVADWPLPHPPTVLWMPYMAYGACLGCTWVPCAHADDVDVAAGLARRHARREWGVRQDADLPSGPLAVWRRDGPFDEAGPVPPLGSSP